MIGPVLSDEALELRAELLLRRPVQLTLLVKLALAQEVRPDELRGTPPIRPQRLPHASAICAMPKLLPQESRLN